MDKLKRFLNGNDRDDDSSTGILPDISTSSMSWQNRITGFVVCFVIGMIISLFGSLALFTGKGFALFAVFYTLGNVMSMMSTCFLMGPVNQLKKMFNQTRVVATVMVFVMMGLTLFAGFKHNAPMSILCMILQWIAMTWYSLSYIPYARDAVRKTFEACIA